MLDRARLRFGLFLDGPDKPVAPTRDRLDKEGFLGRVTQSFAKLANCAVEAIVGVDEGIGRPEALLQFLAGDNLAFPFQEQQQYLEWLILHADAMSLPAKFARTGIDLKSAKALNRSGRNAGSHHSSEMGRKRFAGKRTRNRANCTREHKCSGNMGLAAQK